MWSINASIFRPSLEHDNIINSICCCGIVALICQINSETPTRSREKASILKLKCRSRGVLVMFPCNLEVFVSASSPKATSKTLYLDAKATLIGLHPQTSATLPPRLLFCPALFSHSSHVCPLTSSSLFNYILPHRKCRRAVCGGY